MPDRDTTKLSWTEKLWQLDLVGTAVLIPGVTCVLLALQWGGQTYPVSHLQFHIYPSRVVAVHMTDNLQWSSARIIALLTVGCLLLVTFVAVQILFPATATIPPRIFKQRSIVAGSWSTICVGSSQYIYSQLTLQPQPHFLWHVTDCALSLLPSFMVSVNPGRLCRRLWHPASTAHVINGSCLCGIWIHHPQNRVLHTSRHIRVLHHGHRSRTPYYPPSRH